MLYITLNTVTSVYNRLCPFKSAYNRFTSVLYSIISTFIRLFSITSAYIFRFYLQFWQLQVGQGFLTAKRVIYIVNSYIYRERERRLLCFFLKSLPCGETQ